MTTYRVWTGDGTMWDGSEYQSKRAAVAAIRERRGYAHAYLAEHCDGSAWSVYGSPAQRDADADGAFADTITVITVIKD